MQGKGTGRERADAALAEILEMFESGALPAAIARTRIVRDRRDRPMSAWSLGNQLLALLAGTEDARGYRQWQEAGRHVKGAKAFAILGPRTAKRTEVDENGQERERVILTGFVAIPVFRLDDTEGVELDYAAIDYSPPEPPPLFEVAERLGVPVSHSPSSDGAYGLFASTGEGGGRIVLGSHDVAVFLHELAHAAHRAVLTARGASLCGGQAADQEIVAEVVSATLCVLYGLEESLGTQHRYIEHCAEGGTPARAVVRLLAEVQAVLDLILGEGAAAAQDRSHELVAA
jgi:hypothetical protein